MHYYTSNWGGVFKVHVCDSTTGKVVTIWSGQVPGSYNVINEIVDTTPGSSGGFSKYQTYIAGFTEVQRTDVLTVLQNLQTYTSSF
jgi:hypothetical protein